MRADVDRPVQVLEE
jgi:hypothetical protein